jgi:parallel beta-helix repeat protein
MRKAFVLAVIALGALAVGVSNALAKDLVVDKDKVQCPKAAYISIQAAVAAASPGDRISVCPDTYVESVNVPKPLEIVANPKTTLAGEDSCLATTPAAPDPTKDAIVDGGAFSFNLAANNVKLDGFVIQGSAIGVQTSSSFSGYDIANNLVQNNTTAGINFLSGGANASRVSMNCLRVSENGEGVESETGPLLANARVDHNAGTGNGVFVDASGVGARDNVTFDHNESINNGVGFLISNSTNSSIDHNYSEGDANGVNVGGSNNGLAISNNTVVNGPASGITASATNSFPPFAGPNTGLEFDHNVVTGHARGIRILADAGLVNSRIDHNDTSANVLYGILLEAGNTDNTIDYNKADDNGQIGIYSMGATGNTFLFNSMFGNAVFDARDDARASNTWSGNHCNTDFPPGTICGV